MSERIGVTESGNERKRRVGTRMGDDDGGAKAIADGSIQGFENSGVFRGPRKAWKDEEKG